MRNTWAAYLVSTSDGSIAWTLGGKASTFTLPANAQFGWQHDVELHPGNQISMFDDACCNITAAGFGPPIGPSRGLVLRSTSRHIPRSFVTSTPTGPASTPGSSATRSCSPNGNVLVGWGSKPYFTEFSKTGQLLLDVLLPGSDVSYRALLGNWAATPSGPPAGAARNSGGGATVYASWDGATTVATWRVLAGAERSAPDHGRDPAAPGGFRDRDPSPQEREGLQGPGAGRKGHVIGTSRQFSAQAGQAPEAAEAAALRRSASTRPADALRRNGSSVVQCVGALSGWLLAPLAFCLSGATSMPLEATA